MTATLQELLGKICHIYLDDIMIWLNTVEQHTEHICLVLSALCKAKLYCNPKKCYFYLLEMEFLGHHISARGIEANISKVDKILNWPIPHNTTEVWSFLGLVCYISWYLPNLADFTRILTPLKTWDFPPWTAKHNTASNQLRRW